MCIDGLCRPFSTEPSLQDTMYTFVGLNASTEPLTTFDRAKQTKTVAVYLSGIASVRLDTPDASITIKDTVTLGLKGFEKKDDTSQSSGLVIGTVVGFVSNKRCPILSIQTNQPAITVVAKLPAIYKNPKFKWVANERMYNAVSRTDITEGVKCKMNAYQVKTVDIYDDAFTTEAASGQTLVYLADGAMTLVTSSATEPFYFAGNETNENITTVITAAQAALAPSATGNLKVTFACKQGTITKNVLTGDAKSDVFDDGALYYVTAVTAGTASSAPASSVSAVASSVPAVASPAVSKAAVQKARFTDYTAAFTLYNNAAQSDSVESMFKVYAAPIAKTLETIAKQTLGSNESTTELDTLQDQLLALIKLDLDACKFPSKADADKLKELQERFEKAKGQKSKGTGLITLEKLVMDVQAYVKECKPMLTYELKTTEKGSSSTNTTYTQTFKYTTLGVYKEETTDEYVYQKLDSSYVFKDDSRSVGLPSDLNTFTYEDNDVIYTYKLLSNS